MSTAKLPGKAQSTVQDCVPVVELCLDRDDRVVSDKLIVFGIEYGTWVAKGEENHFHKINSCFETTLKLT